MYQLKTDIPAPAGRPSGRPAAKFPFADMAVGASFFVTLSKDEKPKTVIERVKTSASRWRKLTSNPARFRVVVHDDPDTGLPAIGTWRIS